MSSQYMIGTTAENIAAIDALFKRRQDCEPRGDPMDYAEVVTLGDGTTLGQGWLKQTWHFDFVGEAYRNALYAYAGKAVYVRTRKNDGTFGYFTALFVWPEREPEHDADRVLDLTIELRKLVEYTV